MDPKKLSKNDPPTGHQDALYTNGASPDTVPVSTLSRLTLALDVRRGAIGLTSVAAVVVIAGLTALFHHGLELRQYDAKVMPQKERDKLLDKYNGYSGNVASALSRPLETVVGMMTQLLILRFLASALLQPEPKWHVGVLTMGLSAALGFLLSSGFDALNVQLRDLAVEPVIDRSDLSIVANQEAMNATNLSTVNKTFAETQPNNSIANTVLRGVVLPTVPKVAPQCKENTIQQRAIDDAVIYGFPQEDWMKYMLPHALNAKTIRIIINATDRDANKGVKSSDLPMNASRAADLFVATALLSYSYIPWGKESYWLEKIKPDVMGSLRENQSLPTAMAVGLLPPSAAATELEQRDFFLRAGATFFNNRTIVTTNISQSDILMEFAHVDISPTIAVDAMSWRVEVDPTLFTTVVASKNRYQDVICRTWPGICHVPRQPNDMPMVVHAYAACENDDGTTTLQTRPTTTGSVTDYSIECPRASKTSMIILSASKQLVASAVVANFSANASGVFPKNDAILVPNVASNLRKFYTFTVSRVAWTPQDLAAKYNAKCGLTSGACMGLDFELTNGKRLVVGADHLPLNVLGPLAYNYIFKEMALYPTRLVTVSEPPITSGTELSTIYGDFLLPHNVGNMTVKRTRGSEMECSVKSDDRQQLVLNNHVYMESTLQTSYTAAMFFLFQNAVVRDAVPLSDTKQTLSFNGNIEKLSLWISIPLSNAILTWAGCGLLALGFVSAMVWSKSSTRDDDTPDSMQAITTPHVIARVMLDDNAFPLSVVRRRIAHDPANYLAPEDKRGSEIDCFYISSLTLSRRDETQDGMVGRV